MPLDDTGQLFRRSPGTASPRLGVEIDLLLDIHDERGQWFPHRRRPSELLARGQHRLEARILPEDRLLELLKRRARLDPQLFDEGATRVPVDVERLGLTSRPVEREHQLGTQPLAEGMFESERFELRGQLGVLAERELGLDPVLERGQAQLLEPHDFGFGKRLERQIRQRPAPPERECGGEPLSGIRCVAVGERGTPLVDQALEAHEVDALEFALKLVSGRARDDHSLTERLAEVRDVDLERVCGARRRGLAPDALDQRVRRDRLVRAEQEHREHRSLLCATEIDALLAAPSLERPEEAKLHLRQSLGGDGSQAN